MIDLPFNHSIRIPIEVTMLDGLTPLTGQAAYLLLQITSVEDGTRLDTLDGQFRLVPTSPNIAMTARPSPNAHIYYANVTTTSAYRRGFYRATVTHSVTGETWQIDFSLGLTVTHKLGVTATYDGTTLDLGAWIEEDGVYQQDYASLTSAMLLTHEGAPVAGGGLTFWDGANGVFYTSKAVAISTGTPLIVQATATVSRFGGSLQFPVRSELIRP